MHQSVQTLSNNIIAKLVMLSYSHRVLFPRKGLKIDMGP